MTGLSLAGRISAIKRASCHRNKFTVAVLARLRLLCYAQEYIYSEIYKEYHIKITLDSYTDTLLLYTRLKNL